MALIQRIRKCLLPTWVMDTRADDRHPHRRRFTAAYRRKRGIVKNIWIASGLVMIIHATPAIAVAMSLGTTFLSFMILDETS